MGEKEQGVADDAARASYIKMAATEAADDPAARGMSKQMLDPGAQEGAAASDHYIKTARLGYEPDPGGGFTKMGPAEAERLKSTGADIDGAGIDAQEKAAGEHGKSGDQRTGAQESNAEGDAFTTTVKSGKSNSSD